MSFFLGIAVGVVICAVALVFLLAKAIADSL